MRLGLREGAVSKRVILNCLITWSTRCAHRPLGRRPAICPHGTGAPPLFPPRRACQHRPRMQISTQSGAGLWSVVRRPLRVRTLARRIGVFVLVRMGPVGTSSPRSQCRGKNWQGPRPSLARESILCRQMEMQWPPVRRRDQFKLATITSMTPRGLAS